MEENQFFPAQEKWGMQNWSGKQILLQYRKTPIIKSGRGDIDCIPLRKSL